MIYPMLAVEEGERIRACECSQKKYHRDCKNIQYDSKIYINYCLSDGLIQMSLVGKILPDIHLSLSFTLIQDLKVRSVPT